MQQFPDLLIPDIQRLAKNAKWDPRKYVPMVHNSEVKHKAENLIPGTLAYDDFWDEMDYYCYNGFQPKGMPRITGRHFYYLNFTQIDILHPGEKKKRLGNPFYRDLDHWLFLELEGAGLHGYGIILAKPRRVGLSEFGAVNANYELTFFSRNKIGICAGKDDKAQEFYQKLESSLENTHVAYRSGILLNNDNEMKLGYKDRVNKQSVDRGLLSLVRIKTMFADSSAFEGGSYSMVIFEEIGLFENLNRSYKATEPCFMEGDLQFGVPLLYGTGGEIDKGAKGFKEMWDNHVAHNLKRIFVPANYYYPGDGIPDKETGEKVSFFNYKTGCTDRELAKKYIDIKRKRASRSRDTYIKHIQSYPMDPSEVFIKTTGGILDLVKLQFQMKEIHAGNAPDPVQQGKLVWKDTPSVEALLQRCTNIKEKTKVRVANNIKVKFVADKEGDIPGTVWIDSMPINQNVTHLSYKPDIGACDSYDEEVDEKKKQLNQVSSGCVMAYRCFSGPSRKFNKPVGLLFERGDGSFDDDVFYENAVKFAIFWDMEILFEYTKFHILRYFYDVGAHKYIKSRPNIEEAGTDRHNNKDGIKMTPQVKPVGVKLLKAEVRDNIHKCFFDNIIMDLINFGEVNTDIAMTYLLVLLFRMDIFEEITDGIEYDYTQVNDDIDYGSNYYIDIEGNLRLEMDNPHEFKLQTFIPERDLDKRQYEQYLSKMNKAEEEVKERQTDFEKKAKELGIDPSLMSLILKEQENNGWN